MYIRASEKNPEVICPFETLAYTCTYLNSARHDSQDIELQLAIEYPGQPVKRVTLDDNTAKNSRMNLDPNTMISLTSFTESLIQATVTLLVSPSSLIIGTAIECSQPSPLYMTKDHRVRMHRVVIEIPTKRSMNLSSNNDCSYLCPAEILSFHYAHDNKFLFISATTSNQFPHL